MRTGAISQAFATCHSLTPLEHPDATRHLEHKSGSRPILNSTSMNQALTERRPIQGSFTMDLARGWETGKPRSSLQNLLKGLRNRMRLPNASMKSSNTVSPAQAHRLQILLFTCRRSLTQAVPGRMVSCGRLYQDSDAPRRIRHLRPLRTILQVAHQHAYRRVRRRRRLCLSLCVW
jgi:hypothetical protein